MVGQPGWALALGGAALRGTLFAAYRTVGFGVDIRRGDSRDLLDNFAAVGADLYEGEAGAHPAAPSAQKTLALLAPEHPTRRRLELQLFLVDGPSGRGRVAAMVNPKLLDEAGHPIGLMGFFECDEQEDTARRLLDEASEWLQRRGCALARGPIDLTTWHNYRFVTESNTSDWIPGEPYHHDYYPALWRAAGLEEVATYSSNWLGEADRHIDRFAGRAKSCREAGYTVRHIIAQTDLNALYTMSLDAFSTAWMYSPIEREEFAALYTPEQAAMVAPSSYLAISPEGEPVGFLYAFPIALAGRAPVSVCKTVAVVQEHQDKRPYHLLMHTWFSEQSEAGCREFVGGLMHCDGAPALMGWTKPDTLIKEYKVYERRL